MAEIVYVLTNPAMPGLCKIGHTSELEQRLRSLDTTGVPLPFECFYAAEVTDRLKIERALHEAFDDHRIRKSREFFRLSPDKPRAIIRLLAIREVTPGIDIVESADDQRALNEERQRRARFRFDQIGLQPGAELTSVFDDTVSATVRDHRTITFRGETWSLSGAAQQVASENGFHWTAVQGPAYWKYDGVTLAELRDRLETATDDNSEES